MVDPLAGSYYIEWLTDRMEEDAEAIFAEIDELGGVVRGIEEGYFQRNIALSARRYQRELEGGERLIVGVNAFTEGNAESDIEILRIGPEIAKKQHARIAKLRESRDSDAVERSLKRLEQAALNEENVVEPMLDAVRSYATLGEIRGALERVYGRFREPVFF